MPNLIPQDIREWMRRMEFKVNDLTRRMSSLIPGDIADGVDLNGFKSTGRFRRPSITGTTTALNYPFNGAAGTLEVYWEPSNPQVHQVWYDRSGSIYTRWWNNVVWSAWFGVGGNLPAPVTTNFSGTQAINAATNSALPTPVTAVLALPPGTFLVEASISCLIGGGTAFSPSAVASVRYALSGLLTFNPGTNGAGIGGVNQPIGTGGGTLQQVHTVTAPTGGNLTIAGMAVRHQGSLDVTIRDITVQLTPIRRL